MDRVRLPRPRRGASTCADVTSPPVVGSVRPSIARPGIAEARGDGELAAGADETQSAVTPKVGHLPPRDDAEAGYARDLVSFGRGNGGAPRGSRLSPSVVNCLRSEPSGLTAYRFTGPAPCSALAWPYNSRPRPDGAKLAPLMPPVAIAFAVIVAVSITASETLVDLIESGSSNTARYRESGDHVSGMAVTPSLKKECDRHPAIAYRVRPGRVNPGRCLRTRCPRSAARLARPTGPARSRPYARHPGR